MEKEFELFLPLRYNNGAKIGKPKFDRIKKELLSFFEGLTISPHKHEGFWKMGDVVYRDEIAIYRAVTSNVRSARKYLKRIKEWLKVELMQEENLIIEKDVRIL